METQKLLSYILKDEASNSNGL